MAVIKRGRIIRADLAQWDGKTSTYSRVDATGGTTTGLAIGNEVDVLQVYGLGTARTVATINSAKAQIGSSVATLVFAPGTWTIDSNLTIPSNLTCRIPAGVAFSIDAGVTLTFSGLVFVEAPATWATGSGTVSAVSSIPTIRTAAEISAGVTPVNYAYAAGLGLRYGIVGDGTTNNDAAFANAISQAAQTTGAKIKLPKGNFLISTPIIFTANEIELEGEGQGTIITYSGTDAALRGNNANLITNCRVKNLLIRCTAAAKGIDWTWFSYSYFEGLTVDLDAANSVGFYAKGNGLGTGPYYNEFDGIIVSGQANEAGFPNQYGIQLAPATSGGFLADGPNANVFSNIQRVLGLNTAIDIQSGHGNLINNVQAEAINAFFARFNNRVASFTGTATSGTASSFTNSGAAFTGLGGGAWKIVGGTNSGESGAINVVTATTITPEVDKAVAFDNTSQYELYASKAVNNKISGVRMEDDSGAQLANFYAGALDNEIVFSSVTSIANQKWTKGVDEGRNWAQLYGVATWFALQFTASDLAANATVSLAPQHVGAQGGIRIPVYAQYKAIAVAVNSFGAGGAGTATVKVITAGVENTDLATVIADGNRFGTVKYAKKNDVSLAMYTLNPGKNIAVDVTTSAAWDQTSADVCVTILLGP